MNWRTRPGENTLDILGGILRGCSVFVAGQSFVVHAHVVRTRLEVVEGVTREEQVIVVEVVGGGPLGAVCVLWGREVGEDVIGVTVALGMAKTVEGALEAMPAWARAAESMNGE